MGLLFRALVWRYVVVNRLRSGVTVLAVALGVAIVLAINLANATAVASFASSVNVVSSAVNLQVLGAGSGFDERTLLRVAAIPGVMAALPTIEDGLTVGMDPADARSGEVVRVLGVDLLRPVPGLAATAATPGSFGGAGATDPGMLVDGHGAIVSARLAAANGWQPGRTFAGLAGGRSVQLRVAAILPAGTAAVDSTVAFVDIATAQEIFAKVGRLDRIDCIVDPARLATVTAAIERVLPPGVRAIAPARRTGEIRRMLRSFELNLAVLAVVALVVGMFLIYNTVAISVVQRRPEIGTLRALGAGRRALFAVFVGEGLLFGIVGSLAGVALGAFLATFSVAAVSRTVDTLYVASHADAVTYDPLVLLGAFGAGIAASILAAIVPALEAAATPPAIAMRLQGFERRSAATVRAAAFGGFATLGAGFACTFVPAIDDIPVFGYLAGLLIILGAAACAPLAVSVAARIGIAAFATRSPAAGLAAANLGASPIRIGVAVASLTVAIAMMVSIAILIGSFRTTVVAWANDTLRADLFVRPAGGVNASFDARFPATLAPQLARLPGIETVSGFRGLTIPFRGRLTTLAAVDLRSALAHGEVRIFGLADPARLAATLPGSTETLVSDPFAQKFGVRAGDRITLATPAGPVVFRVAGVYNDYASDAGTALIDAATYRRLFHDDSVNSFAIYARPGTALPALRTAVLRAALPLRVDVETTGELRALVIEIFNRTFAITYALYVISIAIAVLGVVSTLFALVLERRREIGLLRYLGVRAGEVRRMVLVEAAGIGLLGGLGGVVVGTLLALLLIYVINRQAFGWLIELHVPYDFLLEAIVLVVVAALLAGIYPARVAARIQTADAVRSE